MSAATIKANNFAAPSMAAVNPWLIAILVALASFMEVLDTTIANVALPYIADGMGVSEDEASWVVTTYLVANAIILTASSYLAKRLGRKPFFLISLGLFTLSSLLAGNAPNLTRYCCSVFCRVSVVAAWCRSRSRFSQMHSRRRSAARPLRCSALPWWSRRRWAAGSLTISPGSGSF
jgi:MFS family permease